MKVNFSTNTVFDKPYKYFAVQKKFATGYFSFTPEDLPPGTVMRVNPAEAAGAGIELDKEYFAVQWNSPVDANGVQVPTELVSIPIMWQILSRPGSPPLMESQSRIIPI